LRHTPADWQIVVTAIMETMRRRGVTAALGWHPATKNSVKPAWRTIATFTRKSMRSMRQTPEKSWRLNSMPPLRQQP
jgi:hypothetical protein